MTASTIDPQIARSWLLVSGIRSEDFDPAADSRADQIILDIEDAVDPKLKADARTSVIDWLSSGGAGWVRINDRTTEFWSDDVDGLKGVPGLSGAFEVAGMGPSSPDRVVSRHGQAGFDTMLRHAQRSAVVWPAPILTDRGLRPPCR